MVDAVRAAVIVYGKELAHITGCALPVSELAKTDVAEADADRRESD